ncbi:hypothetical protein [Roseibium sp.]|uniref:hypothetical protein n=1 Tax=Roseibium sp. TaxID=1936156 RepID=UPI003D0C3940
MYQFSAFLLSTAVVILFSTVSEVNAVDCARVSAVIVDGATYNQRKGNRSTSVERLRSLLSTKFPNTRIALFDNTLSGGRSGELVKQHISDFAKDLFVPSVPSVVFIHFSTFYDQNKPEFERERFEFFLRLLWKENSEVILVISSRSLMRNPSGWARHFRSRYGQPDDRLFVTGNYHPKKWHKNLDLLAVDQLAGVLSKICS